MTDLFDEVKAPFNFDLFSLDVEGNELSVLQGLDLNKCKPKWMMVETRGTTVHDFLSSHSYEEASKLSDGTSYFDVLFRRQNGAIY